MRPSFPNSGGNRNGSAPPRSKRRAATGDSGSGIILAVWLAIESQGAVVNPPGTRATTPSWSSGAAGLPSAAPSGVCGLTASRVDAKEVDFGQVNPSAERSGIGKEVSRVTALNVEWPSDDFAKNV